VASDTMTRSAPVARAAVMERWPRDAICKYRPLNDSGAKRKESRARAHRPGQSPLPMTTAERSTSRRYRRKGMGSESKLPRASRLPRSSAAFTREFTSVSATAALWR